MKNTDGLGISLPIVREIPESLETKFSNNFAIQQQDGYFVLSFFEVRPPLIIADTQEDANKQLEGVEEIPAVCQARIAIPEKLMPEIFKAIHSNLEKAKMIEDAK